MEISRKDLLKVGDAMRYVNWAGPCMRGYVTRVGRTRYNVDDGRAYIYFFEAHTEPCERCTDHPQTDYPRGYDL
jgi:hypothetical protein